MPGVVEVGSMQYRIQLYIDIPNVGLSMRTQVGAGGGGAGAIWPQSP